MHVLYVYSLVQFSQRLQGLKKGKEAFIAKCKSQIEQSSSIGGKALLLLVKREASRQEILIQRQLKSNTLR